MESLENKRTLSITIDDRERNHTIRAVLASSADELTIKRLLVGDYVVRHDSNNQSNIIIIERKTLTDYINSVIDGRLFRQAAQMQNANGSTYSLF